jgi:anti-sigma factor RsiW
MSAVDHDQAQLGAYVLGALDVGEAAEFEAHLATCAACRREVDELSLLRDELDEIPPEAFLDGPPEGGDMLLQRTLREVRAEQPRQPQTQRRPRLLAIAGAAAVVVVTLGAGVFLGRQTAPDVTAGGLPTLPPASSSASTPPAGTRNIEGTDPKTGARLAATVTPAAGWVKVHLAVQGIKEGEKCKLIVVSKQGEEIEAGSWVVSAKGEKDGIGIDGTALVAPEDVQSVQVVTTDGRKLVSASV